MDNEHFDAFLDDATHTVANMWQDGGGRKLTIDEKYEINDWLTAFFGARRTSEGSKQ